MVVFFAKPRVFISYSPDSDEHARRVLEFATCLRERGVELDLDPFYSKPSKDWQRWYTDQLRPENSDFVLVVCTAAHYAEMEGDLAAGDASSSEGLGIDREGQLIRQAIYESNDNRRFIPILLEGSTAKDIPPPLQSLTRYEITSFAVTENRFEDPQFEALYRNLMGQPEVDALQSLPFASLGPLFKGREKELQRLQDLFTSGSNSAVVIQGRGGLGKTRLAVEYAWQHRPDYAAMLFVAATTQESLQQGLAALCHVLDLPEQEHPDLAAQEHAVTHRLASTSDWLLILDDADSQEAIAAVESLLQLLAHRGHVLITSRAPNWGTEVEHLALGALPPDAAAEFLLERTDGERRAMPDDESFARDLADKLEGLASELEQAAELICNRQFSLRDYQEYSERRQQRDAGSDSRDETEASPQRDDVFICCSAADMETVKRIYHQLEERGVPTWLASENLEIGSPWRAAIEAQLAACRTALIFLRRGGTGSWQEQEINYLVAEAVRREIRLIPVLLPASDQSPELPIALRNRSWVDLADDDAEGFELLIWGITGERPTTIPGDFSEFDVYLSHNFRDKPAVDRIARQLMERGVRPWFDTWALRPGDNWQKAIETQIGSIACAAIFVGEDGLGAWQETELNSLVMESTNRGISLIPVLLQGVKQSSALPGALRGRTWVDLRDNDQEGVERLVWGIAGERPQSIPSEASEFDVYLAHNSRDKPAIERIASQLIEHGVRPWLDVWELRPGRDWQKAIETQIRSVKSVAVFVGRHGIGRWQQLYFRIIEMESINRGIPLIPVILPDVQEVPELPTALQVRGEVDFRVSEPDPLERLIWGIKGPDSETEQAETAEGASRKAHSPKVASARRAAILIGVQATESLPPLDNVWQAVEDMREWALGQGIESAFLHTFTDEDDEVSVSQIAGVLRDLLDLKSLEQLIIYFAGHSIERSYSEYWLLCDAASDPTATVNLHTCIERARYCSVPHVVIISDTCRTLPTGILAQSINGSSIFPIPLAKISSAVDVFYGRTLGQPALDQGQTAVPFTTVYTQTMLEALSGQDGNLAEWDEDLQMAVVRPRQLAKYLALEVPRRTSQPLSPIASGQIPDAVIESDNNAWLSRVLPDDPRHPDEYFSPDSETTDDSEFVATQRRYLHLSAPPESHLTVGEAVSLTLELSFDEQPLSVPIDVPLGTMELTAYVRAPGFHVSGEHPLTITVAPDGIATPQRPLDLIPVISGEQSVTIEAYQGGHVQGVDPARMTRTFQVVRPAALPDIKELIDRRAVPDPLPDVVLYVTLEETSDDPISQQVRIFLTCPALGLDRLRIEQPLPLTEHDLEGIRQAAFTVAARANGVAPRHGWDGMQAFGAALFDQLMPRGNALRDYFAKITQLGEALSCLVISDDRALLPWELVVPYGAGFHADFLARTFRLGHWVLRQGLAISREAPLGPVDLTHYDQCREELPRWQIALGTEEFVTVEERAGHLALMEPNSPYYGLHVVSYAQQKQAGRITLVQGSDPNEDDAQQMIYGRWLDFTMRRPVVGLSFVDDQPAAAAHDVHQHRLEAGWMLPFMHAGASALVGARWPVSPEADQLFYRTFYHSIRRGEQLGWAMSEARDQVLQAFPERADWLAYTYFGHPECEPYLVRPAQGFTLFEILDHPEDEPLVASQTYRFRASYRAEAPVWYGSRLRAPEALAEAEDASVTVLPLLDGNPRTLELRQVAAGDDYQGIVELKAPGKATVYPVSVRFECGGRELAALMLNLEVVAEAAE